MKLIEVLDMDNRAKKEFLHLPLKLYKNEKNWIRPLDADIETVFDRKKNPCFEHGNCIRWILQDDQGQTMGRVAAFYDNRKVNADNDQPTGGMGFFECIDDQDAAFMLFDAAKKWLTEQGMEAMDGPINFGDRSRWWGLLVDGLTEPNYGMPYNFTYYQKFFEAYGFKDYFQQYTFHKEVHGIYLGKTFYEKAERLKKNKAYSFKNINKKEIGKHVEDFRNVYNASWVKHAGVPEMTLEEAHKLLNELKPVIDERLIWFAYYNDRAIGFMVMIPELNQLFKHVNGKLDLVGKLKFAYHRWRGSCKKILGLVIGVLPRFHGRGVESALVEAFSYTAYSKTFPYTELEFNWVGDFHPTMSKMYESLDATVSKTHITYRLLFDPNQEFKRHPVIN